MRLENHERKPAVVITPPSGRNGWVFSWQTGFYLTKGSHQNLKIYVAVENKISVQTTKDKYHECYAISEFQREQTLKNNYSEKLDYKKLDINELKKLYPCNMDFITNDFIWEMFENKRDELERLSNQNKEGTKMTTESKGSIKLAYVKPNAKSTPHGGFAARVCLTSMGSGRPVTTKSLSIGHLRSQETCFQEIKDKGIQLAIEYGIEPPKFEPMQYYIDRANSMGYQVNTSRSTTGTPTGTESELVEVFGNPARFRAMIKRAAKSFGLQKIAEVLDDALTTLSDISKEILIEEQTLNEANRKIATVVMEARKAGVKMPAPSPEIERIIRLMSKPKHNGANIVWHELDGIKWDGNGTPPANYLIYRQQHGSFDALRMQ